MISDSDDGSEETLDAEELELLSQEQHNATEPELEPAPLEIESDNEHQDQDEESQAGERPEAKVEKVPDDDSKTPDHSEEEDGDGGDSLGFNIMLVKGISLSHADVYTGLLALGREPEDEQDMAPAEWLAELMNDHNLLHAKSDSKETQRCLHLYRNKVLLRRLRLLLEAKMGMPDVRFLTLTYRGKANPGSKTEPRLLLYTKYVILSARDNITCSAQHVDDADAMRALAERLAALGMPGAVDTYGIFSAGS